MIAFVLLAVLAVPAHAATRVTAVAPEQADVHRFVSLPATLAAHQQATLYAKVGGYLTSLSVEIGDAVAAGQQLGEIEVPELIADRVRFRAEAAVAEADFERLSAAKAGAPDLVTPKAIDESRGRLAIARASLERVETLLGYARLTAPFAGIVTERHLDPGAFVPAATGGSTVRSAAIVTIASFETIRVHIPVPASEALRVAPGQPVRLSSDAIPGRTFEGKVSRHAYAIEGTSQTLAVEADLGNPERVLRPGMFVTARLGVELHRGVLTVPSKALLRERAGAYVFVLNGSKARKAAIKAGFDDGERAEVQEGLTPADRVLLPRDTAISDGADVLVEEPR